ncbi:hypothetical protein [Taibaiella helva]|uniref:hypothetical protein n=1 Tax=Taibaiella helva TaxID=2301235 RepID=UPI0013007C49|nr:hypothetical protein [Taibaiella helva]
MTLQAQHKDPVEMNQIKQLLDNPEFYLKNLEEYQKMLELLSLNEHLTELLREENLQFN